MPVMNINLSESHAIQKLSFVKDNQGPCNNDVHIKMGEWEEIRENEAGYFVCGVS